MTRAAAAGPRVTDATVVERSLGDPDAFATLFDRHADAIHRYAARRLGTEAADDVTAETFTVAFQRRDRYDFAYRDATPWLYGIATNLIRSHRRAEARRWRALARQTPALAAEPEADRVAARVSAQAIRPQMLRALAGLPARQRDVLLLYAWAELGQPEIAAALSIAPGTVKSRLHRACTRIRHSLAAAGELDPRRLDDHE
jgi:RNA polymerase sigma factor (sigma-70 family)